MTQAGKGGSVPLPPGVAVLPAAFRALAVCRQIGPRLDGNDEVFVKSGGASMSSGSLSCRPVKMAEYIKKEHFLRIILFIIILLYRYR